MIMMAPTLTWRRDDGFLVTTDLFKLQLGAIHEFLTRSYWAEGISRAKVAAAIRGSLAFSLLDPEGKQVGFARAITDAATFAYLADVYVLEEFRGRGLGTFLMECVKAHPFLKGLRRWALVTRDAHSLYRRFGFKELARPEGWMEMVNKRVYKRKKKS
ncbi:MAG TPA: GNAT family N-acetyltransferase [Thermoanaerobaculia bacterium]|jgi:GNAT superfamily N-acetyltransferase|nr:GNAT family N-acetyltransferase [Thermoanaerobaculia bacterium]